MNTCGVLDGVLDGILDGGVGRVAIGGLSYSRDGQKGFLSRGDLSRVWICGSMAQRSRMTMEMVLREAETGERHAILDLSGNYTPLIDYIPSLRIYRFGRYASVNPFKPFSNQEDSARIISKLVQSLFDLNRDERIYLERGLVMAYNEKVIEPTLEDIGDRLLQIQAEVQPKEAYKVECLKNVLWEINRGAMGDMIRCKESEVKFPAVLDLSNLGSSSEKALIALCLLLRGVSWGVTSVVVDPADWIFPGEYTTERTLVATIEGILEGISRNGALLHLGTTTPSLLPKGIAEGASAYLFCGPMWERDLASVERTFALDREDSKALRQIGDGSALLCVWGKTAPMFLRPTPSCFREIPESEVIEHMRVLGDEPKQLSMEFKKVETKMLEKVFKDRAALVYAWEVLRLVRGGRVPVDAVAYQKNVLLKAVVKALKRYFMIVEYTDSAGMRWYRLTKVGERAVSEMVGDGMADEERPLEDGDGHNCDKEREREREGG